MARKTPEQLRAEADRIEAEELKAERLATAHKIPTCPECGCRRFEIPAHTTALATFDFEDADDARGGDWDEGDITEGEHTDTYAGATCADCGADVVEVLERFGWTFYDDPKPRGEHDDAACTRKEPLDLIHAALDGRTWTPDTTESIAEILRAAGYVIRSPEEGAPDAA